MWKIDMQKLTCSEHFKSIACQFLLRKQQEFFSGLSPLQWRSENSQWNPCGENFATDYLWIHRCRKLSKINIILTFLVFCHSSGWVSLLMTCLVDTWQLQSITGFCGHLGQHIIARPQYRYQPGRHGHFLVVLPVDSGPDLNWTFSQQFRSVWMNTNTGHTPRR